MAGRGCYNSHLVGALVQDGGQHERDKRLHGRADVGDERRVGLEGALARAGVRGVRSSVCQAVAEAAGLDRSKTSQTLSTAPSITRHHTVQVASGLSTAGLGSAHEAAPAGHLALFEQQAAAPAWVIQGIMTRPWVFAFLTDCQTTTQTGQRRWGS